MSIKTILIDDEPLAIMELQAMLKKHTDIDVVATAENAVDAIEKINEHKPELIFLDINMPSKSGFDLLEELDEAPLVIFVTAYDQYAIKAFDVNALDYILKPVNTDRLAEAIEKIKKQIGHNKSNDSKLTIDKRIFIKDGEQCFFVPLAEITLIESVGNYARIYYQNKKPLLHKSLNYLEEKLPDTHFFRAGRQHIINTHFIKNINPFFNNALQVEMQTGIKVDISQRQSVKFKEIMGI
ncbi:MAG: response regulator [Bacteroidetes bacterium]|nr:response regulator [Bacteroidota bacterium]